MDSLRIELSDDGVGVQVISPGFVATDIRERAVRSGTTAPNQSVEVPSKHTMSVEECVAQMLPAIADRRRELVMMRAPRLSLIAKVLVPRVIDRIARSRVRGRS
jgi:short-subunit dehydrogenase